MQIELINLDRTPERLAEFAALNGHLSNVVRFPAIDGRRVDRGNLVARGVIEAGLDYTDGAIGNALSHFTFWQRAAAGDRPVTVCEDDAIFNHAFDRQAPAMLDALPAGWHLIFWGWNFDASVLFGAIPGVSGMLARFNQRRLRQNIDTYRQADLVPHPVRLLAAFGIVCYTISPAGARLLLSLCRPLRRQSVFVSLSRRPLANKDLSIPLAGVLPQVNAFASLPPLVVTRNDTARSTVSPPS